MQQWWPAIIASAVSTGAIGLVYFLIRRMVLDFKMDTGVKIDSIKSIVSEKVERIWHTIDKVRDEYMEEEKHELICGKGKLEIEKVFSKCLKSFEDNMFEHIRNHKAELTRQMNEVLKQVRMNGKQ